MKLPGEYIAGFIDGEGFFTIVISKHQTKKLGLDARLHFQIELRIDDWEILQSIQETLECGKIYQLSYERYGWHPHVELKVSSFREITEKLIPFLSKYPLRAKKKHSYELFLQAVEVFRQKEHLTLAGIERLRAIRSEMNCFSHNHQASARIRENRVSGRERSIGQQCPRLSQNTARQASKVGSARSG
jgi:hypothetical protein